MPLRASGLQRLPAAGQELIEQLPEGDQHGGLEDLLLGGEVAVEHGLGDLRPLGDGPRPGAPEPLLQEDLPGGGQNRGPPLRTTEALAPGGRLVGLGHT